MFSTLRNLLDRVRSSLWFIPAICVGLAGLLAAITPRLDGVIPSELTASLPLVYTGSESRAQSVLTTIATSMIGVAGVVFSMTIVSLQLASGQFGPRLLRTFLRNRTNQIVLGTFMATFFYSIMVLPAIGAEEDAKTAAEVSVTVAIALAVVSLAMLVYYIDNVAQSIHADAVVESVSRELSTSIENVYPATATDIDEDARQTPPAPNHDAETSRLHLERSGYLRFVNFKSMLTLAEEHHFNVELTKQPGQYVRSGETIFVVRGVKPLSVETKDDLCDAISLGPHRTTLQDPAFGFQQLTELAVRALSPGINDPTTASHCIDRIGTGLGMIVSREPQPRARVSESGRWHVAVPTQEISCLLRDTIDTIARAASDHVVVYVRIAEALEYVANSARRAEDRDPALDCAQHVLKRAQAALHDEQDLGHVKSAMDWAGLDQPQPAL